MESKKKIIVEMDGRAVYATRSYANARRVAWRLINKNRGREIIVQLYGIIIGI